jgi:hypothetical protein
MRRNTLWVCALLATATLGCEQVNEQVTKARGKIAALRQRLPQRLRPAQPAPAEPRPAAPATPAAPAPAPAPSESPLTGQAPTPPAPSRPTAQPERRPERRVATTQASDMPALRDEPYVSNDTGTIAPGMTENEVYALWGPPAATRHSGEYTYLYFRNGCEYTCGMLDLVTLQNGQVVDAVLRWPGHDYSGQSSSPKGVLPRPTPAGDTLVIPPPTTP